MVIAQVSKGPRCPSSSVWRRQVLVCALCAGALPLFAASSAPAVARAAASGVVDVQEGTDLNLTVSPDHKTIVMDLQGLLYALPIDGGRARPLTSALEEASHPAWSPRGDRIALQSYRGGTFHIWTMRPDGTDLKQITSGHGDDREPAFSPDAKTIAFSSDRAFQGSYDIWTVDLATGDLKQVTNSEADEYEPAWSADGRGIAYVKGSAVAGATGAATIQGKSIEEVDLASGAIRSLATAEGDGRFDAPSWSPHGRHLALIELFGTNSYLRAARLMVDGKPIAGANDDAFPFPAAWLSDKELIYAANGHIVRADLETRAERAIPFRAAIPWARPRYLPKKYDFDSSAPRTAKGILAPALSPEGKRVAFTALNQLWVMEIGKEPHALTRDAFYKQGPAWSPDGKTLAYVSDKGGVENIYLFDLESHEEKQLAPDLHAAQIFPAWSPDGKWIAFQDQTGATRIAEVGTGKIRLLAPATFFPGRPAWSADGSTIAIATVKPYTKRFREGTSQILTVDVATGKARFYEPAPFESITTRTEDGPVYAPNGKEMAFVMDDLLYAMPVDGHGLPDGPAVALNQETTDAPTWSADSSSILYLHNGALHRMARATGAITAVAIPLTYTVRPPEGKLLIHAGRLWTGQGPDERENVDILIAGNRIASITPHGTTHLAGVRVIDASSLTALPGLWENHAHPNSDNSIYYGDRMGRLWLAYGITELRDMADNAYRAAEERESFAAGAALGPRLFATGEAIDGERVYYPMMIPTTSEAQLDRELERLRALDFDLVKLYVRLPYAWMVKANAFAHDVMGVETASHYLLPAVQLGNDGMSHISATSRTGYAYSRSLTGASYQDVRALLSQSGMFTISTLLNMEGYADNPSLPEDPRYGIAPPWELARLRRARDTVVHEDQRAGFERIREEEATVAADFRDGGLILAGTDSPLDLPATSLHLNLRMQVKYGLLPWQALETVTSLPAKAYHLGHDLGTLEAGKLADLILVAGDPLRHIDDVANVQCVMKNGEIYSVADIAHPFVALTTGDSVCGR